jgi:hypothetical protein
MKVITLTLDYSEISGKIRNRENIRMKEVGQGLTFNNSFVAGAERFGNIRKYPGPDINKLMHNFPYCHCLAFFLNSFYG